MNAPAWRSLVTLKPADVNAHPKVKDPIVSSVRRTHGVGSTERDVRTVNVII